MTPLEIVADVTRRLDESRIPYAVGGSFASGTWGQQRYTQDADIAIRVTKADVPRLVAAFGEPYYITEGSVVEGLQEPLEFRSAQLLHMEEVFKIDLFLLSSGAYEASELDRARLIEVFPGTHIRFSAPENIVLAKLRWFELGNRISDKQWNDIVQVLEIQKGNLDEAYLDRWAEHFGVLELLNEARSQTFD